VAISFNTAAAGDSGGNPASSMTIAVPGGVLTGDVMLIIGTAFINNPSVTIAASSTATAPVLIGSEPTWASGGGYYWTTYAWYVIAGGSDAGATITLTPSVTSYLVGAMGAWTGASNAAPVDISGHAHSNTSTFTFPSETTGVAGDWEVLLATAFHGVTTAPGSDTARVVHQATGAMLAVIYDSNGSVGGAGTSIGGETFATGGGNTTYAGFTIGLAAPTGASNTRTAALALAPSFARTAGLGVNPSLALAPGFAAAKGEGHKASLALAPSFSAVAVRNFGKGGSPDRHHHRGGHR
jgi:hypothetical protein